MKLQSLESVELKAVEFPERIIVPPFADKDKLSDRIFGCFCRINPELPCMEDSKFIKNVFTCIKSAGGKDLLVDNKNLVNFVKTDKEIAKWRKWYSEEKERKADWRKENKDMLKERSEKFKKDFGTVLINGIEEPIASYTIEPEGIFFGRGDSPLSGFWKKENTFSDIVLNTNSKNLPVAIYNKGNEKVIKEDNLNWKTNWNPDAHFAAQYNIDVGIPNADGSLKKVLSSKYKMIQFGASSSVKKEGQSKKYEAASELGKAYDKIMDAVKKDFRKKNAEDLSTQVAVFMLFEKGIRIGEPHPTENGTKGLLALVWGEDVNRVGNKIRFHFLGKDSVKDTSSIETTFAETIEKVWSSKGKLKTSKELIKAYISELAPSIKDVFSPKLCRTAVAASVMTKALEKVTEKYALKKESSDALKKLAFNEANMEVAKRLNHQSGVNKVVVAKREEKLKEKNKQLKDKEKKLKILNEGRLEKIKSLKESRKEGYQEKVSKLKEQIQKSEERLLQEKRDLKFKKENGGLTGSTSKAAYIDPGIVSEWCAKVDLGLDKIYTKTQMEQFSQFFKK